MNVGSISIIEFLIRRVKNFQILAEIILSTSYDKRDKKLIEIAKKIILVTSWDIKMINLKDIIITQKSLI